MKKAVRANILYGSKVIKIVVDDQPYSYSAEDIRFIVNEAAAAGLKVAAHCLTDAGARNAIEGGVASIEHGHLMTDSTLRKAADIVATVANPLDDITALRKVSFVMKEGKVFSQ